jgi:hypothetical protein
MNPNPDDRIAEWLDNELPRAARSYGESKPPLWLPDAPARRGGLRPALAAAAVLAFGLVGGGGTLLIRAASSSQPAACSNSQSEVVENSCATGSPTASPSPSASASPTAEPTATPGTSPSPSPSFDNHGAAVSNAAHTCPTGSGGVHGQCVSAVAKSDQGKTEPHSTPSVSH